MFLWDILAAVCIGILVTALFSIGMQGTRSIAGILAFFFIVFLMAWAGGIWFVPVGPVIGSVRIVPFVGVAIIIALLMAAATPPWYRPWTRGEAIREHEAEKEAETLFNVFFWILMAVLVASIVTRYLYPQTL